MAVLNFGRLSWLPSTAFRMFFQSNGSLTEILQPLFFNFEVGPKKLWPKKSVG